MPRTKSHVNNGHAYFKHTGRYNEVKTSAKKGVVNDAPTAKKQKTLAPKVEKSAAAQTLKNAWAELGWQLSNFSKKLAWLQILFFPS